MGITLLKPLGTKGQLFNSGMTLAYHFLMLGVGLLAVGGVLIIFSETFIGIHLHQYALDYGVNTTILGQLEFVRKLLPLAGLISFVLGSLALAHSLSSFGGG